MTLLSKLFGRRKDDTPGPTATRTREQFADHYVWMLAEQAPELTAERVDTDVRLRWSDGGTMNQFLRNAYAQYLADPDSIEPILEAQLAAARATATAQGGLDLDRVLPLIKSTAWLATAIAQVGEGATFVTRPLVADLIIVFAQDLPDTIAYVKIKDLEGVCDEAELAARAMSNLSRRVALMKVNGGDGRYRIELDGLFDASLILVVAEWIGSLDLEGDPVFAIPSRDQLMVCGSANAEAVVELAEIAPQIAGSDAYAISGRLLTLRNGVFEMI